MPPKRRKTEAKDEDSEKEHLHLHLDSKVAERLRLAALDERVRLSAMAEALLREALDAREAARK